MENEQTRLAAARLRAATAREEYAAAVADTEKPDAPAQDWKARQKRAVAAAVSLGLADAEVTAAEIAAGVREPPPAPVGGKMLVALVRVPERAAAALRFGAGDFAAWVADALAVQYRSDFDFFDDDARPTWGEQVAERFGASAADADGFAGVRAGVVDADGETADEIAAALDRAKVG